MCLFVGELVRLDFALVAEQEMRRPLAGKVRAHQSERVGRHLLAVVTPRPGLQVKVGELGGHDGIRRSGEVEDLHSAVIFSGKHTLSARHHPHHRDRPANSSDLVSSQFVGDNEALFEPEQFGAERSV